MPACGVSMKTKVLCLGLGFLFDLVAVVPDERPHHIRAPYIRHDRTPTVRPRRRPAGPRES